VLDRCHRPACIANTEGRCQRRLRGDSRGHTHRSDDTNRAPPRARHGDRPHAREAGKEQALRDALEALIPPTSREERYVNYDLHQGIEDPSLFYLYENWETVDTHETHMHTPHLDDFAGRLDDLLDRSLTVVRVRRIA
jgi:quinol monooxygenase YgiN